MSSSHLVSATRFLSRPGGRLAYDVRGSGPLVVCLSGMGDLRSTYRHLAPALADADYRVAVMELRGHGDSDVTFDSYDTESAGGDLVALLEELGEPAVLVGHSMGAAAGFVAAARRPDLVTGLVAVGPFARNPPVNRLMLAAFRLLMEPPWARAAWRAYLPTLYAGRRPADFDAHRDAMIAALARPGHTRAFCRTTRTSHQVAEDALASVRAPVLVVMGEMDKDFPDPAAEASWIAEHVGASSAAAVLMVPEAGHYPHAQRPDVVLPEVLSFLAETAPRA